MTWYTFRQFHSSWKVGMWWLWLELVAERQQVFWFRSLREFWLNPVNILSKHLFYLQQENSHYRYVYSIVESIFNYLVYLAYLTNGKSHFINFLFTENCTDKDLFKNLKKSNIKYLTPSHLSPFHHFKCHNANFIQNWN